ncbi:hypothetical protein [Parasphingorhabdus sp.]|uniref:hypothetical protein n=1 Tax=Parasphingorhabdus sp. TaxID=2709688 RepID=UPI003264001D
MHMFPKMAAAAVLALSISACSDNEAPDAGDVTETQMDEVDVIDGTISDDMVDVDAMNDAATTDSTEDSGSTDEADSTEVTEE